MPFFKEKKDILELQFEKPNVNFLVDEDSEAVKLYNIIKQLDFSAFYKKYSDKGAVAYRPEILFAVIILSILEGILSSRAIEKKCKRDVYYIYFTEYRKPDHSTIARFLKKFRIEIAGLLPQLIALAKKNKISTFNSIAIDGSKFQSASSKKHSMRMENLNKEEKLIQRRIEKLLNIMQENDKKENKDERETRKLEDKKKKLEERKLLIEESKKELAERQKTIRHKNPRRNHQINVSEPDARMMKDIKSSGYNIQLAVDTETEFIVNASVEVERSDHQQFGKQHSKAETLLGEDKQREYIADAGYMANETLNYVEANEVNAYINSREITEMPALEDLLERGLALTPEYFIYSKDTNEYTCPNNRKLIMIEEELYECDDCSGCLIKSLCAKKNEKRRVSRTEFRRRIEEISEKIKQSPEKMHLRKSVERVFGNIKWNLGYRRFTRKGIEGASVEIIMIALALNLRKIANAILFFLKQGISNSLFPTICLHPPLPIKNKIINLF